MDLDNLNVDKEIKDKINNVCHSVDKISDILQKAYEQDVTKLNTMDKINYDLFISYSLNTLYWLYLRTKGIDPNAHEIKTELNRVREYMQKAKQARDRNTIRPKLNKDVSKRFIKHNIDRATKGIKDSPKEPPKKKKKF